MPIGHLLCMDKLNSVILIVLGHLDESSHFALVAFAQRRHQEKRVAISPGIFD